MNNKLFVVGLLICFWFSAVMAKSDALRPVGENCSIEIPPKSSGEDAHMYGGVFKVYPRAKDISKNYSGCQIIWHGKESLENFSLFSIVKFEKGRLVRFWAPPNGNSDTISCEYINGLPAPGGGRDCAKAEGFPVKSMRPGCLNDFVKAQLDRSLPLPKDCLDYE